MADTSYYSEAGGASANSGHAPENARQHQPENGYVSDDDDDYPPGMREEEVDEREEEGEAEDATQQERDYYAILNVTRNATDAQLRQSYRQLSLHFHPDKQPPHLRAEATARFNVIQKAYETLIDPRKRTIYDTLGEQGLRMQGLEVGTKAMSKEEFQYYIEDKLRRLKREALEREVGSHSTLIVGVDGRSWFGFDQEFMVGPNGELIAIPFSDQLGTVTRVFVQHGFHVPMERLRRMINEPVSVRRVLEGIKAFTPGVQVREKSDSELNEEQAREAALVQLPPPILRLSASLGGRTMAVVAQDRSGRQTKLRNAPLMAQAGMEVSLVHAFPAVAPTAPEKEQGWMEKEVSIARLMADSQVALSHQILQRTSTLTYNRPIFGRTAGLQVTAQVYHAIKSQYSMPMIEAMLTRPVTRRGTFFIAFGTGSKWGLHLPFGLGKWGVKENWWGNASSKVGFNYIGSVTSSTMADDEFDEGEGDPTAEEQNREEAGTNGNHKNSESNAIPKPKTNPNTRATFYLAANNIAPTASVVTIGLDISRTFLSRPRPQNLPPMTPLPNSHRGIRANLKTSINMLNTLSLSVTFTRAVATHSHIGLSVSIDPSDAGVVFGIVFRRLGQKIQIPVLATKFMDGGDFQRGVRIWGIGVITIASGWWIWETTVVRPWERRMNRLKKAKTKRLLKERMGKAIKEAAAAVELMKEAVQRKMVKENESGGLVILEATYGLPEGRHLGMLVRRPGQNKEGSSKRINVAIPVAALVDNSQLVIQPKISKAQIPGFFDPFPGHPKTLKIKYLFRGILHEVEVPDPKGVICPNRGHIVENRD